MIVRAAVVFVVVGLLVAAVLYDEVHVPTEATEPAEAPIVNPSVSDPSRLDGAWYCPMGSSTPGGFADHTVRVSNLGEEPSVAHVGVLTAEGKGPSLRVEVAPMSTQDVKLSTITEADAAGAVVEMVGGTGVVGHTVATAQGEITGACATHASSDWYFASGRTTRDSREYLALMNPFPEDVRFNMEFYRAAGRPRRPAELQGGVVPANSVKLVEIESYVSREDAVAAAVTTVRGRLVVERLQILNGELGPTGGALQLGVTGPAQGWMLPAGRVQEGGDHRVVVFNPSAEETASVTIELWPVNPTDRSLYGLGAIPRELLPGRFEILDLRVEADRFGLRLPYELGVSVTSTNGVPVVAERWQFANEIDDSLIGAGADGTDVLSDDEIGTADPDAEGEGEVDDETVDDETVDDGTGGDGTTDDGTTDDGTVDDETADGDADASDEPADGAEAPETTDPETDELDVPGILGGESADLAQPSPTVGIATSRGTEVQSRRWVIPWLPTPTADSSVVAVTSLDEAAIEIYALVDGALEGPFQATIAPGGRAIVPVSVSAPGAPVLVVADAPVTAEGQVVVVDQQFSTIPGLPTVNR